MKQSTVLESSENTFSRCWNSLEIRWNKAQSWRVLEFWKHFLKVVKFLKNRVIQGTVLESLWQIKVVVLTVLDLECYVLCMLLSRVSWTSVWLKNITSPDSFMLSLPVLVCPTLSQSSNKHVCSFVQNKIKIRSFLSKIWNWKRPRVLVQNQHPRELISAWNT